MEYYDIFIAQKPEPDPDLNDWVSSFLKNNNMNEDLGIPNEGFLGLDLSSDSAKELWREFKKYDARSIIVPSEYRSPKLNLEQASLFAKTYYEKELLPQEKNTLGDLTFVREDVMWYIFRVYSKILAERGIIPAAYFINIDKIDGHVCKNVAEAMHITLETWFY